MRFLFLRFIPAIVFFGVIVFPLSRRLDAQEVTLTLEQALDRARQHAPVILSAKGRIEEARGRLAGALVRFRDNPLIELDAGPRFTPEGRIADVELGFSQNFELGGRRNARIAGAESGIARETATSADVTRRLLRDVATAFLRSLWAQKRLELLRSSEQLASAFSATAQKRYDAGDIPVLELNLAKSSAVRARSEVRSATADMTEALGDLRIFLGMGPEEPLAIWGDLRDQRQHDLDTLLAAAPERPDLKALAAEMGEAEADVRLGAGFKWPEVGVGGKYSRDEGNNIVQGGLKITLPVFSKGQELQATGNARATRLRTELESTKRTVRSEVRTAFEIEAFRRETVNELEKAALPGLEENDTLARRSYEEGEIGLPELIFIRREILETKMSYANSLLEAALAGLEVEFRAGVLR
jgi:cobalt-zinc-cadmium efflux system outer membrane protein